MAKGKMLGYVFWYEVGNGPNKQSKIYKTLTECRKAAIAYGGGTVYKVYDEYTRQGMSIYQKKIRTGFVSGTNKDSQWTAIKDDGNTLRNDKRYVLNKDGTLGDLLGPNEIRRGGKRYNVGKWGNLIEIKKKR